jgi:hypothetical protein
MTIESDLKKSSISQLISKGREGIKWFMNLIRKAMRGNVPPENVFKPNIDPFIGGMFSYVYDPKHKDTLPFWDKYPLVIPIKIYRDGWLGLNIHYLPPGLRVKLLDALMKFKSEHPNKEAYMKVTYESLKTTVSHSLFAPCVKRYLTSHVRSKIVKINSTDWEKIAVLPMQQFQKKSANEVWGIS